MGFYGNITNTARTQFQFDRVYANRYEMEQKTSTDGVYAGRYCLVEYDREVHTDTLQRVWEFDGAYYTTNSKDATNLLTWGNTTNGMVVFTAETSSEPEDNIYNIKICEFYARVAKPDEAKDSDVAQFVTIANGADAPAYTINYKIDTEAFQISRGYDSTVWQKVYTDGSEKYVMIAELNTVVPTFDVVADAPTMSPIVPHFDTSSTDVYYKLHWQAPWGFRVAQAKNASHSDAKTGWTREVYDKETGITSTKYYNGSEWVDTVLNNNLNAAIYFNRAAFDPKDTSVKRVSDYKVEDNIIKITPTGHSGEQYNKHDGSLDTAALPDTQELTIHLPEIGNMMSDAWDIIHGPNRDDNMAEFELNEDGSKKLDENGKPIRIDSLQGRLDSIAAIDTNQIPIKRIDNGALVGTKINGDTRDTTTDNLDATLSTSYLTDDAWIETKVDADNAPNAIAIHHTFHATTSSESSVNKNSYNEDDEIYTDIMTDSFYKEENVPTNNLTADRDALRLYTPYVDAAGHVVGKNIETVTLPYSYRWFNTIGAKPSITSDLYTSVTSETDGSVEVSVDYVESSGQASQTQDTMYIDPYNKWIQVDAQDDLIRIAHAIHGISTTVNTASNLNAETGAVLENNINIPDWSYDAAGHITEKHDHYYTLPYGFKTIKVENTDEEATEAAKESVKESGTVADTTQDTLTLIASNHWIKFDNSEEDAIYIGHAAPNENDVSGTEIPWNPDVEGATPVFGDSFSVPHLLRDNMGHIVSTANYTITIPIGSLEDKHVLDSTANVLTNINFDPPSGKISTTHQNVGGLLLTGMSTVNADSATHIQATDSINTAFKKIDSRLDDEISRASKAEQDLNDRIDGLDYTETPSGGEIVYSITQEDGAVSAEHKNVGELLISGYVKPTTLANQSLSETESLSVALGKLEYRIEDEVKNRAAAITTEVSDRNTAITTAISALNVTDTAQTNQYVSAVSENGGKISVSRMNLPTLSSGSEKGTVKLSNGTDVAVTGLGSAAYTNSDIYASATVLEDYQVTYDTGVTKTVAEVFAIVASLEKEIVTLKQEIETLKSYHSSNTEAPSEPIE